MSHHDPIHGSPPPQPLDASSSPAEWAREDACAIFQSEMPERIGAGEDLKLDPHMLTCERCRALVSDLEAIADAARQLVPIEIEPPDGLWAQIELAIQQEEGTDA